MTLIALFRTSGKGQTNLMAATNYLYSQYCAIQRSDKQDYREAVDLRKELEESNQIDDIYVQDYILGKYRFEPRIPAPEPINGNRKSVEYAIKHSPFVHKYVSGAIAHAREDTEKLLNCPEIEAEWRDLFEDVCFAGIPKEERLIDWVRHTHKGNIENHFLIPRIHLRSGRSFNPAPPGHEKIFNLMRDYLNLKYDLKSPLNPECRRLIRNDHSNLKCHKIKKNISEWALNQVLNKHVSCRHDIIERLNGSEGKNLFDVESVKLSNRYLSLKIRNREKNIRLYGFIFSSDFSSRQSLLSSNEPDLNKETRLKTLWDELQAAIEARAQMNIKRYKIVQEPTVQVRPKAPHRYSSNTDASLPNVQYHREHFPEMPAFNPNLKGEDMQRQIEHRKAVAERRALLAVKQQMEQLNKLVEQWIRNLKENDNESSRPTISITIRELHKRTIENAKRTRNLDSHAAGVLQSSDQRTDRAVPGRAESSLGGDRSGSSFDERRGSVFNNDFEEIISKLRSTIRNSNESNQGLQAATEQAGNFTGRHRNSASQVNEFIGYLGQNLNKLDRLKSRLAALQEKKQRHKSNEEQLEQRLRRAGSRSVNSLNKKI